MLALQRSSTRNHVFDTDGSLIGSGAIDHGDYALTAGDCWKEKNEVLIYYATESEDSLYTYVFDKTANLKTSYRDNKKGPYKYVYRATIGPDGVAFLLVMKDNVTGYQRWHAW